MSRYIALFKHDEIVGFALVDDADFDTMNAKRWHIYARPWRTSYAVRYPTSGRVLMHRLLCDAPIADHINGNGLDNRRENLRPCLEYQNRLNKRLTRKNKSGYKGVRWSKAERKWRAAISVPNPNGGPGRKISLGYYDDPKEAHKAYVRKAIELHGEFANDGHGPARNPDV